MAKQKRRAVVDKWKKKKFFTIQAPKLLNNIDIAETIADDESKLFNRTIVVNLGGLLNKASKKNVELKLKVLEVQGSNAKTGISEIYLKRTFLRRMFRRRTSKIQSIQYLYTKDKKKIKIKSIVVSIGKIELQKKKDIRQLMENFVIRFISTNTLDTIFKKIIEENIFEEVFSKIKKISKIRPPVIEMLKVL